MLIRLARMFGRELLHFNEHYSFERMQMTYTKHQVNSLSRVYDDKRRLCSFSWKIQYSSCTSREYGSIHIKLNLTHTQNTQVSVM